jgi:hypothetical protein
MVERFFRSMSTDRRERGVVRSVPELIAAIEEYIAVHNQPQLGISPRLLSYCKGGFGLLVMRQ